MDIRIKNRIIRYVYYEIAGILVFMLAYPLYAHKVIPEYTWLYYALFGAIYSVVMVIFPVNLFIQKHLEEEEHLSVWKYDLCLFFITISTSILFFRLFSYFYV